MRLNRRTACALPLMAALTLLLSPVSLRAQQSRVPPRIAGAVDETQRVVLRGNTHPLARAEFDRGPAPADLPLERMLLVLRRSPEQQAVLDHLLAELHRPGSPQFHRWLTPQQFGEQFGPADEDVQAITSWLTGHGFRVNRVAQGRVAIDFSGTAAQLAEAFHTELHKYAVNGKEHWANASDPEIPAALAPVVAGISTIHDFRKAPQLVYSGQAVKAQYRPGSLPLLTFSNGVHALSPEDFITIYNLLPLYQAGIQGSGFHVAIVGRSDFNIEDLYNFQNVFGIGSTYTTIFVDGPDPGDLGGGEEVEAVLDTSWASAISNSAYVQLVVSASTNATDGVDLSELYIIENNSADVMTESFGTCEASATAAEATAKSSLAEQAAAQGITYFVSAGDTGAEGCDDVNSETVARGPISVNLLASSPYVVAVGGTEFNEGANPGQYWSSSNTIETALSYIPEDVWNGSCTSSNCASGVNPNIAAGSGGSSTFYPKPSWQTGVAGIPMDSARDLPDVSLNASGSHDPYLICLRGSCVPNAEGEIELLLVGGTSAAAPSFAGIMALVDFKQNSRQGQANYMLYALAAKETLASCNASSQAGLPVSTCVFNDVTVGNNAVPGETGYGTAAASYQSGVGYDLATGLGSVNATNLVNAWGSVQTVASMVSAFSLNPTSNIQHGVTPVSFSVTVVPQTGMGTPTGIVGLIPQSEGIISGGVALPSASVAGTASLVNGTATGSTLTLPGGTYSVIARYPGDGTYLPSESMPVQITVNPEASTTVVSAFQGTVTNPAPVSTLSYGVPFALGATVTGQSGINSPTGGIVFLIDGSFVSIDVATLSSGGQAEQLPGTFFPSPGLHQFSAEYIGDGSYSGSTSGTVGVTITPALTQMSLQSSTTGVLGGQPVTLTATLTANSMGALPTGNINFLSGSTQVGSVALPVGAFAPNGVSETFTFTTSQLPSGSDSLTAQYAGDANYAASSSTALQVVVSNTFLMTAPAPTIIVGSPGQSGSTTLMFQSATGFSGSAMLTSGSCSDLPLESTCAFSPSSVSFNGTAATVPVTFTINTTAAGWAAPRGGERTPGLHLWPRSSSLEWCIGLGLLWLAARRLGARTSLAFAALCAVALVASCGGGGGGGGSGSGGGGSGNSGTLPGFYTGVTVTVTINGSTQTINNLIVQVE